MEPTSAKEVREVITLVNSQKYIHENSFTQNGQVEQCGHLPSDKS